MLLEEMANNFIKQKKFLGYKYNTDTCVLNEFITLLKEINITIVTKEVIEYYAEHNPNWNTSTLNRNIRVIKEFCKYLKTQDIECYQIPDKKYVIKQTKYVPYVFSHKEIVKIMNNLNITKNYCSYSYIATIEYPIIIKLLYQTGMRIGEVLELKVKDYLSIDQCFYLKETKNNSERLIYLSDKLNNEILNYYNKFHYNTSDDDYLFKNKNNQKISRKTIENYFYNILELCEIKRKQNGPRLHDLRHTFIVHTIEKLLNNGKNVEAYLPILQVQVVHKSLNSLEYYFRLTQTMVNKIGQISEEKLGYLIPSLKESNNE